MTELEQKILDTIQDAFPLEERPYRVLADLFNAQVGSVSEQQVFDAVEGLRKSGVIRRIGGVYDSRALGFISRLRAGKVPTAATGAVDDTALETFAAAVKEIPAITHNYVRSHEYNVWFTVIAQNEEEIQKSVEAVCSKSKLHDVHILSATKKFKINTVMGAVAPTKTEDEKGVILSGAQCAKSKDLEKKALTDCDRIRIRVACTDIPHTLTPFKDWGIAVDELRGDVAQGRMRRFGAILRHQDAGFAYNAMICFNAPSEAGDVLASKPYISHCYERPAFDGFPYNLYAMMHAQSAEELDRNIKEAAESIGNPDFVVLHSVRELKKTSFRFFA